MKPSLSIVIPAFDEQARLARSLKTVLSYLERDEPEAELIVVDDGSADATAQVAAGVFTEFPGIKARVIRYEENRGKGFAVKTGLLAAQSDIALFSDADLSTPIGELPKLIEPIRENRFDVTFGSRALDRNLIGVHQPWRREQGGKIFNLLVRTLTNLPFWDTQCGFKAFEMNKFRPLLDVMTIDRFGFDVEFLFVAYHHGLRLKEIPVRWDHDERTKVSVTRDSVRMFNEVRQIRQNAAKGVYRVTDPVAEDARSALRNETVN